MTAFIFDMDGVIVDSTATHTDAWIVYLRDFGIATDDLPARLLGKHNDELVRELFAPEVLSDEVVFRHGARKEALFREMIAPVLADKLVSGIREFLNRHRDVPMAVASNAEAANVRFVLDEAGLGSYFRVVVDGHQVSRPKPDPEIFVKAAQLLGHSPEDCVIFEDSLTGIRAARASGARVVGVSNSSAELPDVDLTIRDFFDPELEPWLQELHASR